MMEGPRHQHLRKVLVKFSVFAGFEVGWRKLGEVVASMVFLFPEGKEGKGKKPRGLGQRHGAVERAGIMVMLSLRRLFTGVRV